jgi:hypothetical protein
MSEKGKKASLAVHSETFPQTATIQAHAENEWFEDWMDYCDAEYLSECCDMRDDWENAAADFYC